MNIVIPMAGMGSRFVEAGYSIPKPFIPIKGKPMIEHVIDNIAEPTDKVYLLCRLEHLEYLKSSNLAFRKNVAYIPVMGLTEGAACTVLLAENFINNSEPLIIANSDQYVKYDKEAWKEKCKDSDGAIMTFESDHPKWSYAKVKDDLVTEVAEKNPISKHATVGIYYYSKGYLFTSRAYRMIKADVRVNNEFYVCPVFNEIINDRYDPHLSKVRIFPVQAMYGMGTPEDLKANYEFIGS